MASRSARASARSRGHQLHHLKHPERDVGIGPRMQRPLVGDPEGPDQRDVGGQRRHLRLIALQQAAAPEAVTDGGSGLLLRRSRAEKRSSTLWLPLIRVLMS